MKKFLLILFIILLAGQVSLAQQKGKFTKSISHSGGNSTVYFYVPSSFNGSSNPKMVVAMHPNDPNGGVIMQTMLEQCAEDNNFILVCPDDFQAKGTVIQPAIDWTMNEYGMTSLELVMTGYSMGGTQTFTFACANPEVSKGAIAIATAGPITQSAISQMAFAWICGTNDQYFNTVKQAYTQTTQAGGVTKFIQKSGVGHFGQYFYSPEFVSDWNECYQFLYDAKFPPPAPALSAPSNYAENVESPVTFEWAAVSSAESYDFELYEGQNLIHEDNYTKTTFDYEEELEAGKTYTWRLRSKNADGEGNWSQYFTFYSKMNPPETKVALSQPADGATDQEIDPTLIWQEIEGITNYHLQVSMDNFATFEVDDEEISDNFGDPIEYFLEDLEQETEYQWRVRGTNSAGEGPWSDTFTFTTKSLKPTEAPNTIAPEDQATEQEVDLRFYWDKVQKTTGSKFELYTMDDELVHETDDVQFTTYQGKGVNYVELDNELEYETGYKWRVAATNEYGEGPWTEYKTFTTMEFTSVEDVVFGDELKVFPNPAKSEIRVELDSFTGLQNIMIYDLSGKLVKAYFGFDLQNTINVSELKNGEYFLVIDTQSKKFGSKLLINK